MSSGGLPGLDKSVGLLRWGGFGDMLMASIVFPYLKADGYHLTVYGTDSNGRVVRNNPYVDKLVTIPPGSIEPDDHQAYYDECAAKHDRFICLSGSIEAGLLKPEGNPEFDWSHEQRHRECDVNYYDRTLEIAGYPEVKGRNAEMYYSPLEISLGRKKVQKFRKMFKICWVLAGSSPHKAWPYSELLLVQLLQTKKDVVVFFVGDVVASILLDRDWLANGDPAIKRRIKSYCGTLNIRSTLLLAEMSDLVIGPETGVMNAVGGRDVPKILFLSHSSKENLSKYWINTTSLVPDVPCHPCHQIHYTASSCPLDKALESPVCQVAIKPDTVAKQINTHYEEWKTR
jgi:ADP-heptose:LPS heptosyltransferase